MGLHGLLQGYRYLLNYSYLYADNVLEDNACVLNRYVFPAHDCDFIMSTFANFQQIQIGVCGSRHGNRVQCRVVW
jgi:hypothetical protein